MANDISVFPGPISNGALVAPTISGTGGLGFRGSFLLGGDCIFISFGTAGAPAVAKRGATAQPESVTPAAIAKVAKTKAAIDSRQIR